jgi:hypothetical protein
LNGCVNVGVWPRGAQVRRTFGVRLSADSSKKTRQALRRWGLLDRRPPFLDPAVDSLLVAFDGATLGTLDAPAETVMQQRPQPGGMVAHAGEALDHQRDAVQGPQLADEPVGTSALQQGLLDGGELGIRQPGCRAARPAATQRVGAALAPAGVPDAHRLGRYLEPAGDLGLADASGEQIGRTEPTSLEPVTFSLCRRAARDGWHALDPRLAGSRAPTRPDPHPHIPQPDTQDP